MANADISLLFGVLGEGSLGGESGSLIQSQLMQIISSLNKNPLKVKVALDTDAGGQKSWASQLQKKLDTLSGSDKFGIKVQLSKLTLGAGAISDFRKQLNAVVNTLNLDKGVSMTLTAEGIGEIKSKMQEAGASASDAAAKVAAFKVQLEALNRMKTNLDKVITSLEKTSRTKEDAEAVKALRQEYEQLALKIEEIRAAKTAASDEDRASIEADYTRILDSANAMEQERSAAAEAAAALEAKAEAERNDADATSSGAAAAEAAVKAQQELAAARKQGITLLTQMQKAERDWTAAANGKSSASYKGIKLDIGYLSTYLEQLETREITVEEFRQKLASIRTSFAGYSSEIKAAGENTKTFLQRIGSLAEKFTTWFSITRVVMAAVRTIRQMLTNVKDIDSALTQLRIVTGATDSEMESFLVRSTALAKELGQSITDVLGSIETFSRLGYNLEDASQLAKFANILANVASVSTEDATTGLTSIIKGFNMDVTNAEHVADVLVEVGQKYAVSASEMIEAYEKSGAALNAANTSFEKSAGLIAAANASVQNASTVGTALKTISARIRGATSDLDELGEDTEELADGFSKYAKELKALTGFDIMVEGTTDTYKDIYDIFNGIAEVWDNLSDTQQARVSEILGGTRQLQVISSILGNWSDSVGAYTDAMNAAGTATEANATYMDSISGRIGVLKASFQEFSNDLFNSSIVKFFVDLATAIINALDALEKLHLLLPMVVSVAVAIKALQAGLVAIKNVAAAAETASAINTIVARLVAEKGATDALAVSVASLSIAEKAELATKIQAAVASGSLTAAEGQQILTTLGLVTAEGTLTVANHSLATSFKTLMASIPVWGWIALGISAVITAVTALSGSFKSNEEKLEELNNEFDELVSSVNTISSEFRTLKQSADETIPRFAELAKGVNEFGENVSLTDEEYEEFLSLNNRIAEMFPELNLGMDSNGNAMLALSYSADTLTESLNALVEAQRQAKNEETAAKMGDALENLSASDKAYDKQIAKLKERKQAYEEAYAELDRMYNSKDKYKEVYGDRWEEMYQLDSSNAALINQLQQAFGTTADADQWQAMVEQFTIDEEGLEIDWYSVVNSKEFKNAMAGLDREIEAERKKQEERWSEFRPFAMAWLQTTEDYAISSDSTQNVLEKVIGNIDYESIGITNEKKLKSYIEESYIKPITEATPVVQNALGGLFDIKSAFDAGALTVGEYGITDYILGDLQKAGLNDELLVNIRASLDLDDFEEQVAAVKSGIEGTSAEIDEFVNGLSITDFDIVYDIISENGSMSIDELQEELDKLRLASAAMVEPLDFSGFTKDLNEAADSIDDLISAMNKLAEGTELSKRELMELIEQYPELLKQADLFTDGNVEAQRNALNTILDMQEQEYDAQIDAKIAELKATEQVLDDQLALEEQKANLINDIKKMELNGKIDQEEDFVNKLNEFNDLQGQNYVKMADGEVQVNEEALNDQLEQGYDYGEKATEDIWEPLGETIVSAHEQGYTGALTATNNYTTSLWQRIKNWFSDIGSAVATAWSDMWSGNWQGIDTYFGMASGTGTGTVSGGVVSVNFGGTKTTIDGQSVDDWVSEQEEASQKRIEKIEQIKAGTLNAIDNLEKLKGLKLTDIYASDSSGSSKSSSSDKTVEEYTATIEACREAAEALRKAQEATEKLETQIENSGSYEKKIALEQELIQAYKDEQAALHALNDARDDVISQGVTKLTNLGFEVSYDADTNELWIENLEHLNELTASSAGKYDTLQEATNELRKETEELIDDMTELNESNQEGSATWLERQQDILEAQNEVYESQKQLIQNQTTLTGNWLDNATTVQDSDAVKRYTTDIIAQYRAMQDLYHQQAEYLRDNGFSDTSDEVSELSDAWWDAEEQIKSAKENLVNYFIDLVDAAHDAVDEIQNVASTLSDAAQEYADNNGWISVDTYQEILKLGPQYMQMLTDENGILVINAERVNDVIAAKTRQLAVEQALSYVERLRLAATGASNENLSELCFATTEATNSTWGLVYAELALMQQTGLLTGEQYEAAKHNIEAIQSLAENAVSGIGQTAGAAAKELEEMRDALESQKDELEDLLDELEDMKDGCDDLVQYVMDMLKDKIEQQVDALNDAKDAVKEYVDQLKEAMQAQKDESSYEDEVAEKLKEIAKLQSQIDALSLDDSRKAQAEKVALEEELAELQKELSETQADHATEVTEDALDDQYDAYADEKDAEIDVLEESISSTQKLYDMAIDYIRNNWDTLYATLIDWNYEYGSNLNSEISAAWEAAQEAAERYGDFVTALMSGIENDITSINNQITALETQISNLSISSYSSGSGSNGITNNTSEDKETPNTIGETNSDTSYSEADMKQAKINNINRIVSEMVGLSNQWHTADTATRAYLESQAQNKANDLVQYGVKAERLNGTWYITSDNLNPNNIGQKLYDCYPKYHTGGVVGDSTLKQDEVLAVLKNGEAVLDEQREKALYRIIDFTTALSEKLGKAISSTPILGAFTNAQSGLAELQNSALGNVRENQVSINITENITCAPENSVEAHQKISRTIMNEIARQVRQI